MWRLAPHLKHCSIYPAGPGVTTYRWTPAVLRKIGPCPRLTELAIGRRAYPQDDKVPMNVHLTPELEQLVQSKVQSGRYNSASEVVREALRLMEHKDEIRAAQMRKLRSRIDQALGESDRGEGADGEPFMQNLVEDLDTRERKAG